MSQGILTELARAWGQFTDDLTHQRRVLVVDDDEVPRLLFCDVLSMEGFEPDSAGSGADALSRLEPGRYAAVIVDKNLPDMDGLEALRRVVRVDPDCEVIVSTGYASLDSVVKAIDLRVADYLTKPLVSINVLPAAVERAVRRRRRRMLSRRILRDLRVAVQEVADEGDLELLKQARERIALFKEKLRRRRSIILFSDSELRELGEGMVDWLHGEGYRVMSESNPELALEQCAQGRINVVVFGADFGGTPGFAFFDALAELTGRPEVVFIGPRGGHDQALEALRRGVCAYLAHPIYDADIFIHGIQRACREHHERLNEYKVVTELHRVLASLKPPKAQTAPSEAVEALLAEFDVVTAQHAVALMADVLPDDERGT